MRIELLGPIRAWREREPLEIGSPQQRGVLALLLLSEGKQVTLEDIATALWGTHAPRSAIVTTRTYISRLRRALPNAEFKSAGGGYQLIVDPVTIDVTVFRRKTAAARNARAQGCAGDASELLRDALALWRGTPLEGLSGTFFDSRRAWLEQLRASAMEDRWALDIEQGRCEEVIAELSAATAAEPYRERLWELLMWALQRDGRRRDALSTYHRVAQLLNDNLGLEPGFELRRLHGQINKDKTSSV